MKYIGLFTFITKKIHRRINYKENLRIDLIAIATNYTRCYQSRSRRTIKPQCITATIAHETCAHAAHAYYESGATVAPVMAAENTRARQHRRRFVSPRLYLASTTATATATVLTTRG